MNSSKVGEKLLEAMNGWNVIGLLILLGLGILFSLVLTMIHPVFFVFITLPSGLLFLFGCNGFFTLQPNQAVVLLFFGKYVGTVKQEGFLWTNPFYTKRKISLRLRNMNSDKLKVNDLIGNPIEIGAVIVWKVENAYSACLEVDNYEDYVRVQSEAAIRHLAGSYPYDSWQHEAAISLRGTTDQVSEALETELQSRLDNAGVRVFEARLAHLAYAPEIAEAMLKRQQAEAIIAARKRMVEGAVGMVQMALEQLQEGKFVEFDNERKAMMVSNLLLVLCGETHAQPVISAGLSN